MHPVHGIGPGREYTFGLQFLDTDGENILTIAQSYTGEGAQTTMSKIGDMSFETLTERMGSDSFLR